jgi:hypothetical protein
MLHKITSLANEGSGKVSNAIDAVAFATTVTAPFYLRPDAPWRETLHSFSGIFADLAPIVGTAWLLIKIYFAFKDRKTRRMSSEECSE